MRIIPLLLLPILMAMAADETAELKAMQHSYLGIFGPQERAARTSSGQKELVEKLHERLHDADLADIRPFMRMRLEQLLGRSRDPADAAILVDCTRSAVREAEPPYRRDLRLELAERLMRQAQLSSGARRTAVLRRLIDHRQAMARHAWQHDRFADAIDDHDQLVRLYKAAGDRDAYRSARERAAWIEDRAADIESLLRQAGRADAADTHADLALAFLRLGRWDLAADHARLGAEGPATRLAQAVWVIRRWGDHLLAPGVAESDLQRLREHVDAGGWAAAARLLGRLCGHADLIAQARELQLACLDGDADRTTLRDQVHALCDQALALADGENGIRLSGDAGHIRQALADVATLRSGQEDEPVLEAAVLDAALVIVTAVTQNAEALPADLVQQVRSQQAEWERARDALVASHAGGGASSPIDGAEQRLIRAGWQQIFDHRNNPVEQYEEHCRMWVENGSILLAPDHGKHGYYELVDDDWEEILLQMEFDMPSNDDRAWRMSWYSDRESVKLYAYGNERVEVYDDRRRQEALQLDGRTALTIHLRWDSSRERVLASINGDTTRPLTLPGRPSRLTLFLYPNAVEDGLTVRIRSMLGKPTAP